MDKYPTALGGRGGGHADVEIRRVCVSVHACVCPCVHACVCACACELLECGGRLLAFMPPYEPSVVA